MTSSCEGIIDDVSAEWWERSSVKLIQPELLWPSLKILGIAPSDHGRMIQLTGELANGRKKERGLVVELAIPNGQTNAICSAIFGLGAVGITLGGDIIIDCAQVERPTAGAQMVLQNTFMRKVG